MTGAKVAIEAPAEPRWVRVSRPFLLAAFVALTAMQGVFVWQAQARVDKAYALAKQAESMGAIGDGLARSAESVGDVGRENVLFHGGFALVYLAAAGFQLRLLLRKRAG